MLEKLGTNCFGRLSIILREVSPRMFVLGLVFFFLASMLLLNHKRRPAHLDEIATECASAAFYCGLPVVDYVGNRVAYCRSTGDGIGIFLYDSESGKSSLLCEYKEGTTPPDSRRSCLLPWSPNDKEFAFTRNIGAMGDDKQEFVIFHVDSGKQETIPCALISKGCKATSFFSWLTTNSFVYFDDRLQLHQVRKLNQWEDSILLQFSEGTSQPSFVATIGTNRIIWQQGNIFWTINIKTNCTPKKFFELNPNMTEGSKIVSVSYSSKQNRLLISCENKKGGSLLSLSVDEGKDARTIKSDWSVQDVAEINEGKGIAYLRKKQQCQELAVQPEMTSPPVRLFTRGDVTGFIASANGENLIIIGIATNEFSAGIWKYNVDQKSLENIVSGVNLPRFSARSPMIVGSLVSPSGRKIGFKVFLPPNLNRQQSRRYPLVVGGGYLVNEGPALANCEIIHAFVQRKSWEDEDIKKWEDDTWELSKFLAASPIVDGNQIFLAGVSRETFYFSRLASQHPEFWKGILLLSPVYLPEPKALVSSRHTPRVIISAGTDDDGLGEKRIKEYQVNALKFGIQVDVFMQPGAEHAFVSQKSKVARMRELVNCIWND